VSGIPLRRRLFVLTAAAILPLAALAGIGLYVLDRLQGAQSDAIGRWLARSIASAIDAELRSQLAAVETLASNPLLERRDFAGFQELAERVTQTRAEWAGVLLADRDGTLITGTRIASDRLLPLVADPESFDAVVRTRTGMVGRLTQDFTTDWLFAVRTPALRGGAVAYVVTALVKPEAIRRALARQPVPDEWVISIVDAKGLRVARSRAHDENLGGTLSDTVRQVIAGGGAEGFGVAYSLEGERIFTPYSRIEPGGWMAVLGLPTAVVDAATYRSFAVYLGGVLLSIVLGVAGALWVARSITRPMAELGMAAEALGRRSVPHTVASSIQEVRAVGAALTTAGHELVRGEAEREELLRKERRARERAETADRAKEEFMAVLSHELRTPINAVFGWARMLQTGQLRDKASSTRAKDAIVRNADVLVQLIDDLLDLSRISSGKMRLSIGQVDIGAILHSAIDSVRHAADAKAIRIHASTDPKVGQVSGDSARLQQVIWNLLMNAVKFTPMGGHVHARLERAGFHVQLVVNDTGQGIPFDLLPHVFERFKQADSSSTRAHGGLGLGLALVKHLVELHGGTVVAESGGPGQGATFIVTLPVAPQPMTTDSPARNPPIAADAALAGVVRLDGLRVLITDDDRESVAMIEAILLGAGAEVRPCYSASDALAIIPGWRPDALVSDIEMPEEDGYFLIQRVRLLPEAEGGQTPAIALTAYGRPQDRSTCLAAGFNMHVPKPVDPGELTTIIAGVAKTHGQKSGAERAESGVSLPSVGNL
jgi:signal transduction histidine kinase/ActR/RegA family two-component response regulator